MMVMAMVATAQDNAISKFFSKYQRRRHRGSHRQARASRLRGGLHAAGRGGRFEGSPTASVDCVCAARRCDRRPAPQGPGGGGTCEGRRRDAARPNRHQRDVRIVDPRAIGCEPPGADEAGPRLRAPSGRTEVTSAAASHRCLLRRAMLPVDSLNLPTVDNAMPCRNRQQCA